MEILRQDVRLAGKALAVVAESQRERDRSVMKVVSLAVLTALFAYQPILSYSFDNLRFQGNGSSAFDAMNAGDALRVPLLRDDFELGPSGRIDKVSTSAEKNIIGLINPVVKALTDETAKLNEEVMDASDLNISYSDFPVAKEPCGTSPLSVAAIEDLISATADRYGVDPELAKAIAWTESRFDRNRTSDQGARGPMQLMPATAHELPVSEICDPTSNIDGGVRHLKRLLDEFKNPILAIAAYNAGAQAVYDNGGVPPFSETVRYVAAVVNFQLGMPMPDTSSARTTDTPPVAPSNKIAGDVIGARANRFVNGVMHF